MVAEAAHNRAAVGDIQVPGADTPASEVDTQEPAVFHMDQPGAVPPGCPASAVGTGNPHPLPPQADRAAAVAGTGTVAVRLVPDSPAEPEAAHTGTAVPHRAAEEDIRAGDGTAADTREE